MSQISAEKVEQELKSATDDQLRRNREVRANYWRELSLSAKLGPFPVESFVIILAVLLFPSYYTLGIAALFIIIYAIANSKGLSLRQLIYFLQSLFRGKKMTRKITLFGYDIR